MSIIVDHLSCSYSAGTSAENVALIDVSLTIERGTWVSIVGHTGSGKSTLAWHLNALMLPQSGMVEVDGIMVSPQENLRNLRQCVGLVFQYPERQFFAETVREEIEFAPSNWGAIGDELSTRVEEAIALVGLDPALLSTNPFSLSGGERRRVAIASVLSARPAYLILDEPTAGLDAAGVRDLFATLALLKRRGLAIVHVTHDLEHAFAASDKLIVLDGGKSVFSGGPEDTARFLLDTPVRGLVVPPYVCFAAKLRSIGEDVALTAGLDDILRAVEHAKGKRASAS